MSYFDSMQVDVLRDIRDQLKIKNLLEVLEQGYQLGIIDKETYTQQLNEAYRVLK